MERLTVIEAARAGFGSRATIYRQLKAGVLSAETDADGTTVIDTAELTRVFGDPRPHRATSSEAVSDASEAERLRAENALLRAENADLRAHRDRLMTLLERAALAPSQPLAGNALSGLFARRPRSESPR